MGCKWLLSAGVVTFQSTSGTVKDNRVRAKSTDGRSCNRVYRGSRCLIVESAARMNLCRGLEGYSLYVAMDVDARSLAIEMHLIRFERIDQKGE